MGSCASRPLLPSFRLYMLKRSLLSSWPGKCSESELHSQRPNDTGSTQEGWLPGSLWLPGLRSPQTQFPTIVRAWFPPQVFTHTRSQALACQCGQLSPEARASAPS